MDDLLKNLNEPQRDAVLTTDGPVLVLAGAGSGKTKALTHRLAYLVQEKGISPYNILAVTFTNKAAKEMATRVALLLANSKLQIANSPESNKPLAISYKLPWLGTFHSICVRILRREAEHAGISSNFSIYDESDRLSLIKRIMRDLDMDPKQFTPNSIVYLISGAKNELIDAMDYKKYTNTPVELAASQVYEKYEEYMRQHNSLDFDDLIMQCVVLFQNNPEILQKYQETFRYILVDEYQDTNQAQYLWTKLLAAKHQNLMVVGDDYQSIYSWRGANFRNILNFEKDYPTAKVIKLEQNYRSTQTILDAANEVIKYNKNRTDKKLWTENSKGQPITVFRALNEKDEAEFVIMEIKSLMQRQVTKLQSYKVESQGPEVGGTESNLCNLELKTLNYSDFAVLYRTNAQSRAVEEGFLRFGIPYRVVGGYRFYERKEVKDMVSYLRLLINPYDLVALERVVSAPPRGIGEKSLAQIRKIPKSELLISKENPNSNSEIPKKLQDFLVIIDEIRSDMGERTLPEIMEILAEKTGFRSYLCDGTPEGEGRWENVLELIGVAQSIQEGESLKAGGERVTTAQLLEQFLEQTALVQDTDDLKDDEGAVTLMTLHSAKGLEFKYVFIIGAEEGLFPHSRALLDASEMEEERRLAYVGITRARERLYLIHAFERNIFGRFQSNPKSRFIENIPEHLLDSI
ncbi:MAG TPA: UvrD-helicase domain-containing protein [bacterium]|nr:UvrD-helicase domain-containing protein [bacterium]